MNINLINGDCLESMDMLIKQGVKVDAIITDLPYGTTACKWDTVIPFDEMWLRLNKLIKPNGAIVLFGSEPFSSALRMSNIKNYKYDWYWNKDKGFGFLNAKRQPLRTIENIHIFYKKQCTYNPIMTDAKKDRIRPLSKANIKGSQNNITNKVDCKVDKGYDHTKRYPLNIITMSKPVSKDVHPTQKLVALMKYLIKTYTNKGEIILDFTMGSGSTGVAVEELNRDEELDLSFIGIENNDKYFKIAEERINNISIENKLNELKSNTK